VRGAGAAAPREVSGVDRVMNPNDVPMKPRDVRRMRSLLARYEFEDVYGYTWGRNLISGGREAVDASCMRYLSAVSS
jgi:hypothetical protein